MVVTACRGCAISDKDGLHLLMWVSAFVLLIACANLANLMLVRAATRKQQTSVRSALGAPRTTLVRQALTESAVLAVMGGAAGIVSAFAGTRFILHLAFRNQYVPDPCRALLTGAGICFGGIARDRHVVRRGPGLDERKGPPGGGSARRQSLHRTPRNLGTKISGGGAGRALTRAVVRRRIVDPKPEQHAAAALRL